MKHALTQLGAAIIMLFALNINAQVEGLPELGVTLSGTPDNPVVENHTDQTIIGHVLRVYFANGNLPLNFNNLKVREIWEGRKGLEPNRTETPLTRLLTDSHPAARFKVRGSLYDPTGQVMERPVKVVMDSVVFANGQMVGPDVTKTFPQFSMRLAAVKELAVFALQARQNASLQPTLWAELERLTTQRTTEDKWKISLAGFMRRAHRGSNDEVVYSAAEHIMSIPALWR